MPLDYAAMMTPAPAAAPATADTSNEPSVSKGQADKKSAQVPDSNEPSIAEGQESALGAEPESDETEPESDEIEAAGLDDETEYLIDGEKIKGSELKKDRLRQADYTKKTQALAEERRKMVAERDEANEAKEEMLDWVRQFNDPERAAFQLRRNFPQTFEAIREWIIEQALEEQDLDPTTLKYKRAAEQAEIERMGREEDEEYNKNRTAKAEKFKKTAELSKQFNGWIGTAMEKYGLDPSSDKHQKMVRGYIRSEFGKETWTETHFDRAAKDVAEAMGLKPSPQKEAAKKLPTVKPTGQKAPAGPRKTKTVEKGASENFFEKLRRENGLA